MATASFQFIRRNPGHWDVYANNRRAFAIRGEPGDFVIRVESADFRKESDPGTFKTLDAALAYVMAELTFEEVFIFMESQNV